MAAMDILEMRSHVAQLGAASSNTHSACHAWKIIRIRSTGAVVVLLIWHWDGRSPRNAGGLIQAQGEIECGSQQSWLIISNHGLQLSPVGVGGFFNSPSAKARWISWKTVSVVNFSGSSQEKYFQEREPRTCSTLGKSAG